MIFRKYNMQAILYLLLCQSIQMLQIYQLQRQIIRFSKSLSFSNILWRYSTISTYSCDVFFVPSLGIALTSVDHALCGEPSYDLMLNVQNQISKPKLRKSQFLTLVRILTVAMVVTCPNVKSVMLDVRSQSLDQYHTSTVIIVKTETWDYVTCDHGFQ